MLSKKQSILLAIVLLVITQFTRFESRLFLKYDNQNFTITMHNATYIVPAAEYNFSNISATVQDSMVMQGGITLIHILDAENNTIYRAHKPALYLFGKEWFGNMLTAPPVNFTTTFGDWFLDQFDSSRITLYEKKLPPEFTAYVIFAGRGRKSLYFNGDKGIWIGLSDGYIDSTIGYCTETCTDIGLGKNEPVLTNIARIVNLFAEVALIATLIILIISIIEPVNRRL
jgi:hypothetical protein